MMQLPSDTSLFQPFGKRMDDFFSIAELRHTRAAIDDDKMLWSARNDRLFTSIINDSFCIVAEGNSAK